METIEVTEKFKAHKTNSKKEKACDTIRRH